MTETIQELAASLNMDMDSLAFCKTMDERDSLRRFRDEFSIPLKKDVAGANVQGNTLL
jgi:hypothetical protein